MELSAITQMNEQELTRQLGQFLYSTINDQWLSATITLTCLNAHTKSQVTGSTYICTAFYTCEYHPENDMKIEDKPVTITPFIQAVFEQLFTTAQAKSKKIWAEAVFTIKRTGRFTLVFNAHDGQLSL